MATKKRKTVAEESKPVTTTTEISHDLIAARAYEKWEARGCPLWDDGQDWFDAANELEKERHSAQR